MWVVSLPVQLSRFRADPANRGQVMDRGLWLVACSSRFGLAAATAGPALMTYALVAKTGEALLERSLTSSRPGYAEYVARTSGFVPMPRRPAPPNG